MNATILLVEDNPHIMKINREALALRGFRVLEAATLAEGRALLERERPDLILLDVMLPDGSGLRFCEELRGGSGVPVLFLSALGQDEEIVAGLRAGGDDYLPKPYNLEVLLARVDALLRRAIRQRPEQPDKIGNLTLDVVSRRAYRAATDLLLTTKEFSILELLARGPGRPVPAAELYETIWGLDSNEDVNAVKTHVSRLRGKLADAGVTVVITSERGKGYRLTITEPPKVAETLHSDAPGRE